MRYKQTVVVFVVAIALLTVKAKGGEQEPRKTSEQLNSVEVDVGGATSYANVETRNGAPKLILRPQKSSRMVQRSMMLSVPRRKKKLRHREMLFVENTLNTTIYIVRNAGGAPYY